MAKTPTTNNRASLLRIAAHTFFGVGFSEEKAKVAEMRARAVAIPPFDWKPIDVSTVKALADVEVILKSSPPAALSAVEAMEQLTRTLIPFVANEIKMYNRATSIPGYRGLIKDKNWQEDKRLIGSYVSGLRESCKELLANLAICNAAPLLIDIERVRNIHLFAREAARHGWPGADAVESLAHLFATQLADNLPSADAIVPAYFDGFGPHRKMEFVLSSPEEAVSSLFRRVGSEMRTEHRDASSFEELAHDCRHAPRVNNRTSFGDQLLTLARREVLRVMSELPRDRHADLATYATMVHAKAQEIDAEHRSDIDRVSALDISSDASISGAVNALQRIRERCSYEFGKVAPEFLEKYICFRTARDARPNDAPPVEKITADQILKLMPEIRDSDIEMPLDVFVGIVRNDLARAADFPMATPLAHGGGDHHYMEAIGKENSYTRLGADLLAKLKAQEKEFDADHFRRPFIAKTWRALTTNVVESRLREFEKLREALFRDIESMMKNPMFITDAKFSGTVALMEKVRSASPEMHFHFANAFHRAYKKIPAMVHEKVFDPVGDAILLKASSREAERERARAMEQERGMSR
ncbi:hypothetical protein OIU34_23615 [Pararhizobium sp. BT-229]|uniref:hypothetical protein n=1 Tax=Pararhizobium sp. BT-229 TaxID=2986923 RepID=UPI0021F7D09E|nr:hypothetical protein [Pararhizobium sp. BT-229]MCV9964885.1 hypothetical protein [Pararhizobium sp. BT-229]